MGGALALLGLAMNDDIYDQPPPPNIIQGSPNAVLAAHASSQMVLSLLIHVPYYTAGLFGNASWHINGIESNQFTVENTSPMTIFCTNAGMVDVVGGLSITTNDNFGSAEANVVDTTKRKYFDSKRILGYLNVTNVRNNCSFRSLDGERYVNAGDILYNDVFFQGTTLNILNIDHFYKNYRTNHKSYANSNFSDDRELKKRVSFRLNSAVLIVNGAGPTNISLEISSYVKTNFTEWDIRHPVCCSRKYSNVLGRIDIVVKGTVDGEPVIISYSIDALPFYGALGALGTGG
ncbi:hypothetical protein [Leptospira yasudae]|uniref:hypothetical protein n=1 Tax=Leptospira yasudae TaxID=2202201 RepID=UPI001090C0CE|nr:hypothetical protein [Leptospira yasudae]TGM97922.1 hypothetical protein EHR10_13605 [Leptospira yasudae]